MCRSVLPADLSGDHPQMPLVVQSAETGCTADGTTSSVEFDIQYVHTEPSCQSKNRWITCYITVLRLLVYSWLKRLAYPLVVFVALQHRLDRVINPDAAIDQGLIRDDFVCGGTLTSVKSMGDKVR